MAVLKDKERALMMLTEKRIDPGITFKDISDKTGYSKRQLIRLDKLLDKEKDMAALLHHCNEEREPVNKASPLEIAYLEKLKEPYPEITITHFRDIFIEDVLNNPDLKEDVINYGLNKRSLSWFRNLFIDKGWRSSKQRKPKRRDNRSVHPLRRPAAHKGDLIQIDGTPYDWFDNGQMWTLHLAVDDATSEVLAGYFYPTERQIGYCQIMRLIFLKYGIPMALYSDKHTIFKSTSDSGNLTKFATMMDEVGIEFIHANSPQAKGRVERYNGTIQGRLPNDIIRYNVKDYDQLNEWFNSFYIPYINRKFSFNPIDPHESFVPIEEDKINDIFTLRYERSIHNDCFSLNKRYYTILNDDGQLLHLIDDAKIEVRMNVFTQEILVYRYGKRHNVKLIIDYKERRSEEIQNTKDLSKFLKELE